MYVRQAYLLKYVCRQFYIQVKVWWRCRRKKHRVTGTRTRSGSSVAKESCINLDLLMWRNQTRKVYVALWTTQQQQVGRTHQLWLTYTTTTATLSLLSPPAHFIFMFSGMTDQAMVVVWPMKKDDNCSFPVLSHLAVTMPTGRIHWLWLSPAHTVVWTRLLHHCQYKGMMAQCVNLCRTNNGTSCYHCQVQYYFLQVKAYTPRILRT